MNHKEITQSEEHENIRKKLWCDVYVAYVAAPNSVNQDGGCIWANNAVKRFDELFYKPEPKREYVSPIKPLEGPAIIHRSIYSDEIDELNKTES